MAKEREPGIARVIPPDLALLPGIEIETDHGFWRVVNELPFVLVIIIVIMVIVRPF